MAQVNKNAGKNKNINENVREINILRVKKRGYIYTKFVPLSLMGLILLVFALPSVSAISLSISASGWPPCPASTDTSYTITARVTGSTPTPTFLVIAIWDYVEGRYIVNTGAIFVPRGRIDVTRTLTIRTPSVSGEIRYAAVVFYWDQATRRWVFANHVNSRMLIVGMPNVDAANLIISPSRVRVLDKDKNVTLSWNLQGTTRGLHVLTAAFYYDYNSSQWVQIGNYMQRYVRGSFSEHFSIVHTPNYPGDNYYRVAAWYWDWCRNEWRGFNYEENKVFVERWIPVYWNKPEIYHRVGTDYASLDEAEGYDGFFAMWDYLRWDNTGIETIKAMIERKEIEGVVYEFRRGEYEKVKDIETWDGVWRLRGDGRCRYWYYTTLPGTNNRGIEESDGWWWRCILHHDPTCAAEGAGIDRYSCDEEYEIRVENPLLLEANRNYIVAIAFMVDKKDGSSKTEWQSEIEIDKKEYLSVPIIAPIPIAGIIIRIPYRYVIVDGYTMEKGSWSVSLPP